MFRYFRFVILCIFLMNILVTRAEDNFEDAFSDTSANSTSCTSITGRGSGCYECSTCDTYAANFHSRRNRQTINLKIRGADCKDIEVCCYSQVDFRSRTNSPQCGISNPQGEPRRVRESLRSVLSGQYPWRVWIYSVVDTGTAICAGIYVDKSTNAVITLASCVNEHDMSDLFVKFSKNGDTFTLRDMILHPNHDPDEGTDDIAALFVSYDDHRAFPEWVSDACLSNSAPRQPSACIAVSDDDKYINTIIPLQSLCLNKSKLVHESQLCAGAPLYDYEPERGGGIFCDTELIDGKYQYVVRGIFASKNEYNDFMYTNVTQYFDWLEEISEKHVKS